MVLGRTYQPSQRRPMDLACHQLETVWQERTTSETSQAVERRPGQILAGHDLAEDSTRQANRVRQPNAIFPPNPKILYSFFLLIIYHWDVYNDIWGGVDLSPLSNFIYSRWRPRWLWPSLILENPDYFNVFCQRSKLFLPRTCFGIHRKGLRSIGCTHTVAMVTTILQSLSLKGGKMANNFKNTVGISWYWYVGH